MEENIIKCKGVTHSKKNSDQFTFGLLYSMLVNKTPQSAEFVKPLNIVRDKWTGSLKNVPSKINFQPVPSNSFIS